MNPILIRQATMADMPTLLRFEQGVIQAERPFDPTLQDNTIHYYDIEQMITASHIELLVAEQNQQLIGSGYARIESAKPYLKHKQYAYLGFMYVDPAFRGLGVNQKIMKSLEEWVVLQGIAELRLDVYDNNVSALKAYQKSGFAKHLVNMRKGLL